MKRTPLKRHTPLARSTKPLKRSRMNKVSQKRTQKRRIAKLLYEDSRGVAFDDVRSILGEDKNLWPVPNRVRDPLVLAMFHMQHRRCWVSQSPAVEAHHMASGFTRGKSDEMCALAALSPKWHAVVNTSELPLGRLLYLKWKRDRPNCDWVRLTILFGYFLPELQPKG